ncbi:MAG TPA: hypothetical protein PK006_04065 [Saprospiraceae bacterium]|nr:hypothetical protein [Saprospiraceae bacterium]
MNTNNFKTTIGGKNLHISCISQKDQTDVSFYVDGNLQRTKALSPGDTVYFNLENYSVEVSENNGQYQAFVTEGDHKTAFEATSETKTVDTKNESSTAATKEEEPTEPMSKKTVFILFLIALAVLSIIKYFFDDGEGLMNQILFYALIGLFYLFFLGILPAKKYFSGKVRTIVVAILALIGGFFVDNFIERLQNGGHSKNELVSALNEQTSPSVITTISDVQEKTIYRRRRSDKHYVSHTYNFQVNGQNYEGELKNETAIFNPGDTVKVLYNAENPKINKISGLIEMK